MWQRKSAKLSLILFYPSLSYDIMILKLDWFLKTYHPIMNTYCMALSLSSS